MAMILELTQLSPTMSEGVLVSWLKKPGDRVEPGDALAEVETDKAVMEMEAFDSGTLLLQLAEAGETIKPGEPVGIIGEPGEDITSIKAEALARKRGTENSGSTGEVSDAGIDIASATKSNTAVEESQAKTTEVSSSGSGRIIASPLARRVAQENGIDLGQIRGSGPRGRIVKRDLETQPNGYRPGVVTDIASETKIPLSSMRKVIARRLHESKNNIPHYYLSIEVNVNALLDFRKNLNSDRNQIDSAHRKISINDLIVRATALALEKHPVCNSSWREDHILQHGRIDIGVAVALEEGLITPYLRNANRLSLLEISAATDTLVEKARNRKLQPEEFTSGTFTISNLGMYGIKEFTAVINEPEAAILAVGGISEQLILESGQPLSQSLLHLTMSCDHRVIDGRDGALFLQTLKKFLEHPYSLTQ